MTKHAAERGFQLMSQTHHLEDAISEKMRKLFSFARSVVAKVAEREKAKTLSRE